MVDTMQAPQPPESLVHPVPPRALALSLAALVVSATGAFFFPEALVEYGFLGWLLALIPAFLLCYYRKWTRIMALLGAGMALVSLSYAAGFAFDLELPEWPLFGFVVAAYIGIALGAGWFTELRSAGRRTEEAEQDLRRVNVDLRRSHTDLQLAQWKLIEAEKLEAVGQLAAGVAHEVKNPLMTLLTGVKILSQRVPADDEDVQILLQDMEEAVKRADAVITDLLDFSAPRELNLTMTDLHPVVERSAKMVKHELDRAKVTFREELAEDLPQLNLDSFKFQQVLVNVFTNAAHATPPGGTITAKTSLEDGTVILRVDDTGTGIPEDKLGKLFDPFFTTKPTGKGTGLGMSVSRQIVEMHGATIDIANRAEGGARVTIVFEVSQGVN